MCYQRALPIHSLDPSRLVFDEVDVTLHDVIKCPKDTAVERMNVPTATIFQSVFCVSYLTCQNWRSSTSSVIVAITMTVMTVENALPFAMGVPVLVPLSLAITLRH